MKKLLILPVLCALFFSTACHAHRAPVVHAPVVGKPVVHKPVVVKPVVHKPVVHKPVSVKHVVVQPVIVKPSRGHDHKHALAPAYADRVGH